MSATRIYVNLPVADLDRSVRFFSALAFAFDPRLTDRNATCMIVGEGIYVMLLVIPFFQTFTTRPVCTGQCTGAIVCLSQDSREAVDAMVAKVRPAGGRVPTDPIDHGFMYQHGFEDPDGHLWELVVMDMAAWPSA